MLRQRALAGRLARAGRGLTKTFVFEKDGRPIIAVAASQGSWPGSSARPARCPHAGGPSSQATAAALSRPPMQVHISALTLSHHVYTGRHVSGTSLSCLLFIGHPPPAHLPRSAKRLLGKERPTVYDRRYGGLSASWTRRTMSACANKSRSTFIPLIWITTTSSPEIRANLRAGIKSPSPVSNITRSTMRS